MVKSGKVQPRTSMLSYAVLAALIGEQLFQGTGQYENLFEPSLPTPSLYPWVNEHKKTDIWLQCAYECVSTGEGEIFWEANVYSVFFV